MRSGISIVVTESDRAHMVGDSATVDMVLLDAQFGAVVSRLSSTWAASPAVAEITLE